MGGAHAAGGSHSLAVLIEQHGECIYADLLQYYGVNLVSALRADSGFSPRQVLALIRQLPIESRTVAGMRGGEQYRGWGPDRYLAALLVDAVTQHTYAFVAANSKRRPKAPEPVPRPEKTTRKKTGMFAAMVAARKAARTSEEEPNP